MFAPEMSFVVSLFGLVCLLVALPPILRASPPKLRRVVVRSASATPLVVLVAGGAWLALTTSPAHVDAFVDGRWPGAVPGSVPAVGHAQQPALAESAIASAD